MVKYNAVTIKVSDPRLLVEEINKLHKQKKTIKDVICEIPQHMYTILYTEEDLNDQKR